MKFGITLKTVLGTAATLCVLAVTGQAQAGILHNGWNYSIDSFRDGTEGHIIGDKSAFEFYGMAFKQTRDKVYFAFNSNLSLNGYNYNGVRNGKISYGDLFLNFANPSSFAAAEGNLYGVRFDGTNDTRFTRRVGRNNVEYAPELGLYQNVRTTSVTTVNAGYSSLQQHTNTVNNHLKGHASYGDMQSNTTYFDNTKAAATSMKSGSFLSAISPMIDFSKKPGLGLDFAHFKTKGTYTFGFSIDKKYLPNGSFIASLFAECGNDGMVLTGELTDVPEPSVMAGLAVMGLLATSSRLRRREQEA